MAWSSKQSLLIRIVSIGTLLEWAEYTFYGYMAITLSALFFPENDPQVAVFKTFGVFAVGYLMRPVGAVLFGYIGDRLGRKPALMGSLLLMGAATMGIGCLPTYQTIGLAAPLLLLVFRIFQGIAVSGEYNGAAIFLIEKTHSSDGCLNGSWISAAAAAGMVLGGIAAFVTSFPGVPEWAWRIPFLLGGLSGLVGMWFRNKISESAVFLANVAIKPPPFPLFQVFKQFKKSLLITAAIAAFTGIYVYIGNIYVVVFLKQTVGLPTHHATFFAIFGELIVMLTIPLMAYLADKSDPYRQYRWGLAAVALASPIIFLLCLQGGYGHIFLAMLIYGILNGVVCGPMMKILHDQFPVHLRYTGISFAWSISAALFSGTAPMVAQYLSHHQHWLMGPSWYVSVMALITLFIFNLLANKSIATSPFPALRLKKLTN